MSRYFRFLGVDGSDVVIVSVGRSCGSAGCCSWRQTKMVESGRCSGLGGRDCWFGGQASGRASRDGEKAMNEMEYCEKDGGC